MLGFGSGGAGRGEAVDCIRGGGGGAAGGNGGGTTCGEGVLTLFSTSEPMTQDLKQYRYEIITHRKIFGAETIVR